ncbi:MAG TPA: hypothetical protein VFA70_11570 [Dehalococcoidia bacterium]|nr:hypothetical protein [Dehalococcoidia bacterium]
MTMSRAAARYPRTASPFDEGNWRLNSLVLDRRAAGWVLVTLSWRRAELQAPDGTERLYLALRPDGSVSEQCVAVPSDTAAAPVTRTHPLRPQRASSRPRLRLIGAALVGAAALYGLGAFDVLLARYGMQSPLYHCLQYGAGAEQVWYCNGPLSTRPFTPAVQAVLDDCQAATAAGERPTAAC